MLALTTSRRVFFCINISDMLSVSLYSFLHRSYKAKCPVSLTDLKSASETASVIKESSEYMHPLEISGKFLSLCR